MRNFRGVEFFCVLVNKLRLCYLLMGRLAQTISGDLPQLVVDLLALLVEPFLDELLELVDE